MKENDFVSKVKLSLAKYEYVLAKDANNIIYLFERNENLKYQLINPDKYIADDNHYFVSKTVTDIVKTTGIKDIHELRDNITDFFMRPKISVFLESNNPHEKISKLVAAFHEEYTFANDLNKRNIKTH